MSIQLTFVDLKSYFTSKNGFIWEQQRIAIWNKQALKQNKVQQTGKLFYGEKGS